MLCDNNNSMCEIAIIFLFNSFNIKLMKKQTNKKTLVNTESIKHGIFQFEQMDQNVMLLIIIIIIIIINNNNNNFVTM